MEPKGLGINTSAIRQLKERNDMKVDNERKSEDYVFDFECNTDEAEMLIKYADEHMTDDYKIQFAVADMLREKVKQMQDEEADVE